MTAAWIEPASWIATAIAIVGVILNNRRRRECFYLWLCSNGLTLVIHLHAGLWALAVRDGVFWCLAVHGLAVWTAKAKNDRPAPTPEH